MIGVLYLFLANHCIVCLRGQAPQLRHYPTSTILSLEYHSTIAFYHYSFTATGKHMRRYLTTSLLENTNRFLPPQETHGGDTSQKTLVDSSKTSLAHVGQIDQIDHDLDNLDPNLPL